MEWERKGYFSPAPKGEPFTILMPPPNANASLHAGHGMYTIDDILIRFRRMQGRSAQWIPGLDHAGFETQFVYEKRIAKEGKSRMDFDRQTLYREIARFVKENSGLIFQQFRRLGFSADWSRSVFTLDPHVINQVFETFRKMEGEGKVYRGDYLIKYCTHCGTSLAELEINYVEREDTLYFVRYLLLERGEGEPEYVLVATTRPEPIMIDTHLAVNPGDKKNNWLKGRKLANPITDSPMEVVADEFVDPKFGTGIVKLTPAHDENDYAAARRHGLPFVRGIDMNGRMTKEAGEWAGLTIKKAREAVVERLKEKGLLDEKRTKSNYLHSVATCYKCGRDMEPMTIPNWYIKVESLKGPVVEAIKSGETRIIPKRFEKQLLDWMEVMHDWPISRQIAWGIRIPVWYEVDGNEEKIVVNVVDRGGKQFHGTIDQLTNRGVVPVKGGEKKKLSLEQIKAGLQQVIVPIIEGEEKVNYKVSLEEPGEGNWIQETDTFDTWFSSGQWPLVTLKADEYELRYPTDVMATMVDILKFWVSRMMMFGLDARGKVPFRSVYLWPAVVDSKGQKMSKSKGNVINPIDLVDKYGADAFRMSLLFGNGEGGRVPLAEEKVRAMRNFANKIWNAARFVVTSVEDAGERMGEELEKDKEFRRRMRRTIRSVTESLEKMRFSRAADLLYEEFWHWYCDVCIEDVKAGKLTSALIKQGLEVFVKMLHPFMPFVTEAVWEHIGDGQALIISEWPGKNAI